MPEVCSPQTPSSQSSHQAEGTKNKTSPPHWDLNIPGLGHFWMPILPILLLISPLLQAGAGSYQTNPTWNNQPSTTHWLKLIKMTLPTAHYPLWTTPSNLHWHRSLTFHLSISLYLSLLYFRSLLLPLLLLPLLLLLKPLNYLFFHLMKFFYFAVVSDLGRDRPEGYHNPPKLTDVLAGILHLTLNKTQDSIWTISYIYHA